MKIGITERYVNIQECIKGKISIKELSAILKVSRMIMDEERKLKMVARAIG